jgi:hypothetical protein
LSNHLIDPENSFNIEMTDIFTVDDISVKRDPLPPNTSGNLYRLFGVTMASDYLFANPLLRVSGVPDVSFTCRRTSPLSFEGTKKLIYASKNKTDDGESVISIQRMDDGHVVHFAGSVDFYLSSDTIIAHLLDPACRYMVEILLLGEIFSLWLELQGIRTIHASAAIVDNHSIAFLSSNKGGKSGLAAAFTQQGHQILTDDVLPVENRDDLFLARPGYPAMRMWPDLAGHFFEEYKDLEIVHPEYSKLRLPIGPHGFGTFCSEEKPLKVMYVPQRLSSDSDITIEPLSKKNAFFELLQNSFSPGIVEALGLQPERMNFFSRMVMQVSMRRLNYPEGFHHLPYVVDAVLDDIDSLYG